MSVIVPEMQGLFTINSGGVQSTAPELIFIWSVTQGPTQRLQIRLIGSSPNSHRTHQAICDLSHISRKT